MREILFKAKRIDNGEWVEGDLLHGDLETGQQGGKNATCFISMGFGNGFWEVQPETVCQYTGLKDRNGTKIFEGDIIKYKCGNTAVVEFSNYGAFVGITKDLMHNSISGEVLIEIIGDIHDKEEK